MNQIPFESPKPMSETPNSRQVLVGLILGFGYLTIFPLFIYRLVFSFLGNFPGIDLYAQVLTGLLIILLVAYLLRDKLDFMLGDWRWPNWSTALTFAFYMYLSGFIWTAIQLIISGDVSVNENQQGLESFITSSPIILGLLTIVVAPILEEFIFRYFIFKPLQKNYFWIGFLLSTLLFALIHFIISFQTGTFWSDLITLPPYIMSAALLTLVYHKTNRISVAILTHAIYNTIAFLIMVTAG